MSAATFIAQRRGAVIHRTAIVVEATERSNSFLTTALAVHTGNEIGAASAKASAGPSHLLGSALT
jgi:predicted Rossmann fold nucleotide-binding protein DprA/Smf involved in DNA uptake